MFHYEEISRYFARRMIRSYFSTGFGISKRYPLLSAMAGWVWRQGKAAVRKGESSPRKEARQEVWFSWGPPPPHSLPARWLAILMCYWADSSSAGWVISPSPSSAGHESQLPFENSPPIMQADTGMLFKNPQPICWSLLIYKGLRAESPVKTILDTVYTGFFGLWKRGGGEVPLRLPQTITFYCA